MELVSVAPVYEDRLVAFVDLLGFSNKVANSGRGEDLSEIFGVINDYSSENWLRSLFSGFSRGDKQPLQGKDYIQLHDRYPILVTQFSDSFVFSARLADEHACRYFPFLLGGLIEKSLEYGFLVRGGVAAGQLIHHSNGPLFGPAFLKAYELESKMAVYGRIIFDTSALEHVKPYVSSESFLERAEDDLHELTLASYLFERLSNFPGRKEKMSEALVRINDLLAKQSVGGSVAQKYEYIKTKLSAKLRLC